jgi:excisionase family DNA binding protein
VTPKVPWTGISETNTIKRRGGRNPLTIERDVAMERLLKVDDVAELLQVSRWTVYKLIKERELVSVKVRKGRRVPVESVRAYVANLVEVA